MLGDLHIERHVRIVISLSVLTLSLKNYYDLANKYLAAIL